GERLVPIVEQLGRPGGASVQLVPLHQNAKPFSIMPQHVAHAGIVNAASALLWASRAVLLVPLICNGLAIHLREVATVAERAVLVIDVGQTAGHARREIASRA